MVSDQPDCMTCRRGGASLFDIRFILYSLFSAERELSKAVSKSVAPASSIEPSRSSMRRS